MFPPHLREPERPVRLQGEDPPNVRTQPGIFPCGVHRARGQGECASVLPSRGTLPDAADIRRGGQRPCAADLPELREGHVRDTRPDLRSPAGRGAENVQEAASEPVGEDSGGHHGDHWGAAAAVRREVRLQSVRTCAGTVRADSGY